MTKKSIDGVKFPEHKDKKMTNYNEKLDEILNTLGERHIMVEHCLIHLGMPEQNGKNIETRKAKQDITSLIKELVVEAKPINEQGEIDIDAPAYNDGYYSGAWNTLEKFEHNLLKALEEK